ncbi:hypothetical protein QDQ10_16225 [Enterobacter kobei]|uniref:hypothetical protein n=1 Tax=Enterobacter kobei TaxID=208224 RepID=UPI00335062E6
MSVKRYDVMSYSLDADGNSGPFVKYDDYAALEARCAALAAELNEIKVAVMARMKLHEEIRNAGRPPHTDFWHQSIYMADKRVNDSLSSTPNHDAFLAEVRAQGVERLANAWYAIANETDPGISISDSSRLKYRQRADDAADFANEIRQEAAQ